MKTDRYTRPRSRKISCFRIPRFVGALGWSGWLLAASLRAETATQNAPQPPPVADAVLVEIFENAPDQTSWALTNLVLTETYFEPAFGFVALPSTYSPRGVKVDRTSAFLLRASATIALPPGEHRLLLRARAGSRLWVDGRQVLSTPFPTLNADGHEEVPPAPVAVAPEIRYLRPGHFESLANFPADGKPHGFVLEALLGTKGRRPEPGELSASISSGAGPSFVLLSPRMRVALTEEGWDAYAEERRAHCREQDRRRRETLSTTNASYWSWRHDLARRQLAARGGKPRVPAEAGRSGTAETGRSGTAETGGSGTADGNAVDRFIGEKLATAHVKPAPLVDDYAFLRRVTLDTIGSVPSPEQIAAFVREPAPERRARAIDRLLQHPGWADHWVSYWQDVLAENPGILKPMLNNTGPFRWWIHESFADRKPMDRFVTELILMEGSVYYGGPAGFGMATENDVPMAQKAQILAQAFLGMQMQCARCHDAPYHAFKQKELFSLAAMLKRQPQKVPLSSSIPTNANIVIGRVVQVTLPPGVSVDPAWPFPQVAPEDLPAGVLTAEQDSRERLAALFTDPRNTRFARVLVNRVWKRYLGWGIVEPVDDWETATPSHPALLQYLADELVEHDYDLQHVARLILNSHTYQRQIQPNGSIDQNGSERLFASPARRRLTAEQLVDSLFAAVGKRFQSEEMNMDVDGRRPVKDFNNLGRPEHAWEFASLSNERDRPALAMPRAQIIGDTLTTFGWRESRQSPQTVRDHAPNVLQPAALANGLLGNGRVARLSEDHALTLLALEEQPVSALIQRTFLRLLTRPPSAGETQRFTELLEPGYAGRRLPPSGSQAHRSSDPPRAVSWANHLNPEATRIKQELERSARSGDTPTDRLRSDWRERMEDMVWALVNSPEFVFVP